MKLKLGVDISKAKFDVALLLDGKKYRSKVFSNTGAGFRALLEWIASNVPGGQANVHVCMEATGVYHESLALFLHEQDIAVSVVNPMLVKRFVESEGARSKTDSADAKALARYADRTQPELWQAPSPAVRKLQALVGRLETLKGMRQAEDNRLEVAHEAVRSSLLEIISQLDASIEEVRAQIRQTINDDLDLKSRRGLLETIPGLGDKTIPQLLAYIGRPERFKSVKALIAHAGLAPMIQQSGSSLNKKRGTHPMGHEALRHALYFPAMVAGKYNPMIARFWQRLKEQNKPGKVIVVACMHKLLAIAYGVLKSGKPFDPARSLATPT
ncbi:IS110-like element IS621 family transposase [Ramlibacter monticola]